MQSFNDVAAGMTFSDRKMRSLDYSLQLSMTLNNLAALHCLVAIMKTPKICKALTAWASAIRTYVDHVLTFGTPGTGGAPLKSSNQ